MVKDPGKKEKARERRKGRKRYKEESGELKRDREEKVVGEKKGGKTNW